MEELGKNLELEINLIVAAEQARLAKEDLERKLGIKDTEDEEGNFGPGYVDLV